MLGSSAKSLFLLGIVLVCPQVVAAQQDMEFSLDETSGSPPPSAHTVAASDADAQVAKALSGLRWGMSSKELLAVFKTRLRAEYDQACKHERDIVRQDALYQKAKERYEQIKESFVRFDDKKNGWDVSPIASEFRRGSQESMIVVRSAESHEYYFFINDRLWKWYRELEPSSLGGGGFDGVAEMMRGQLGEVASGMVARGENEAANGIAWDTTSTRVTLIKRGGSACLIFESQETLAVLPTLRQNAIARGPKKNSVIDDIVMDSAQQEEWRANVDTTRSPVDKITQKKQLRASR